MKFTKFLFLSVGILVVGGLAIAEDAPADPAIQTQPAATEAEPGTSPAPTPIPESIATEPASAPEFQKEKKTKKVSKTRKVKTACDIFDSPDGKKVGTLKVGTPIWTDEHAEGWVKVYRKSGTGYAKTECFE